MLDLPIELELPTIVYETQCIQYSASSHSTEDMQLALLTDSGKKNNSQGKPAKSDGNMPRVSKNDAKKDVHRPFYYETIITDPKEIDIELMNLRKEYYDRFGRNADEHIKVKITDEERIVLLKHALTNDMPFPDEYIQVSPVAINIARYELHFNKKIPKCQYTVDACTDRPILFGCYGCIDCQCPERYLLWIIRMALYETNEPLPENIVVTELDLWVAIYRYYGGDRSFPAWFNECSYEDKILNLKNTIGIGPGDFQIFWYLTKEEEDSIKIELEKVITASEKKTGRRMTELEKVKAEYELQFGEKPPACECLDEEWVVFLKHLIQYNMRWITGTTILKSQVRHIIDGMWWNDIKTRYK